MAVRLLGPQVAFQDGLGAHFWSFYFDIDFFTAILLSCFGFCHCLGLGLGGWDPKNH